MTELFPSASEEEIRARRDEKLKIEKVRSSILISLKNICDIRGRHTHSRRFKNEKTYETYDS